MAAALRHEGGDVYRLEISGVLRAADFDVVEQAAATELRRGGSIRLLVVLTDFDGWSRDEGWRDLGFYVRYGDGIQRIAIVGDERWESEALMFAGTDLRKAPVKFFGSRNAVDARAWLMVPAPLPESA